MKISKIAGLVVGILAFIGLISLFNPFLPEPSCADGWRSLSFGRQGACSYHRGVKGSFLGPLGFFVALLISPFVGFFATGFIEVWTDRKNRIQVKRHIETKATHETPYGSLQEYKNHLKRIGVSEEQIAIDIEKHSGKKEK